MKLRGKNLFSRTEHLPVAERGQRRNFTSTIARSPSLVAIVVPYLTFAPEPSRPMSALPLISSSTSTRFKPRAEEGEKS
jgi:hypothetical protein